MVKKMKGQGAFEYLMSYGWAVLVVIVLGIVLWQLGVFAPTTTPRATGFVNVQPATWELKGNSSDSDQAQVTLVLQNIAGRDLTIYLNSTETGSIKFTKSGSGNCYFGIGSMWVKDEQGVNVTVSGEAIAIPAGSTMVAMGTINSTAAAKKCGGLSKSPFRYTLTIISYDEYEVTHTDTGTISGRYS